MKSRGRGRQGRGCSSVESAGAVQRMRKARKGCSSSSLERQLELLRLFELLLAELSLYTIHETVSYVVKVANNLHYIT